MTIPLVYIGGAARSGSTLLERMLARIPGFWPVGELVFVWERGVIRNDRCGCGARFRDCAFWTEVGEVGFGGWEQVNAEEAARLRTALDRHRNLDRISGLRRRGKLEAAITAYMSLTGRLYEAVRQVSGAAVIVDSSKDVPYALLLRDLEGFELRLVHLVRRSHGVAYSWSKRVPKPGVGDGDSFMSVHSAAWSVGLWTADNILYDVLARQTPRAARVRYEDLVTDPRGEVLRLLDVLALAQADRGLTFLGSASAGTGKTSTVKLAPTHAFSGNPMRHQQGDVVLRVDDEWRTSMSLPRRALISAATWPLLVRYGYSATPRTHPRR